MIMLVRVRAGIEVGYSKGMLGLCKVAHMKFLVRIRARDRGRLKLG